MLLGSDAGMVNGLVADNTNDRVKEAASRDYKNYPTRLQCVPRKNMPAKMTIPGSVRAFSSDLDIDSALRACENEALLLAVLLKGVFRQSCG
jgi:hypothetical protein